MLVAPLPAQDVNASCSSCAVWNKPQRPFRIYGNTYYVGTHGLSSVLIASEGGHVLIDGALQESAPLIAANIRALGFRIEDVKLIVTSHAHFDHAGGVAELQRLSGARVAASPWSADALKRAVPRDDPQFGILRPARACRAGGNPQSQRDSQRGRSHDYRAFHARSHAGWNELDVALVRKRALFESGLCRQPVARIGRWLLIQPQKRTSSAGRLRTELFVSRHHALRYPHHAAPGGLTTCGSVWSSATRGRTQ